MIELHPIMHVQMKRLEKDKGCNLLLLLIMLSCKSSSQANKT